ncbi:hypothetical protein SISSUDRAFT_1046167 [Sistotremastrum suecicum HHB10207 ss-3]|uniref:DUF6533 domain-containing protein n=1 Tax=Sistotremastrum suecicum HHB10207 ss-3 TaxID=1314776 RepID=A0A166DXB1_9AGAM|nr:hypothetical protein SISSUDRAFT_1046167 [Sistotremastrum suecicum HHB10207 ss-3]
MDANTLEGFANTILVSRYCSICGLTMCLTDIFNTLPREINYYWGTPKSIPKTLYFYMRYSTSLQQLLLTIALFHPGSDLFCWIFVNIQLLIGLSLLWSIEIILIIRIHALYSNKRLLIFMSILFLCTMSVSSIIGFRGANTAHWLAEGIPGLPCCTANNSTLLQDTFWASWIPTLVFESILVGLAIRALWRYRELHKGLHGPETLVWTLLRDSIIYYLVVLVAGAIYMAVAKVQWFNGEPASSVLFPVISACGVRLLFHLQAKNAELRGQDMSMQVLHTHTEIKFKTRPPRSETDIESGSGPTSTVNGLDQIEGPIDDTRTI